MSRYNRVKKIYPDGTILTKVYDTSIHYNEGEKFKINSKVYERQITIEDELIKNELPKRNKRDKEKENRSRSIQKVYDYAKCNNFVWFCTFTLDDKIVDRYDYDVASKELAKFRKWLSKNKIDYLFVPEQHEDGAWHFHGLLSKGIKVVRAINKKTGLPLIKHGKKIYNVLHYNSGFTTASFIQDKNRTNTYITKYLTKEISVPKGRKRYWCSVGLLLPKEVKDYIKPESNEYFQELQNNNFFKKVESDYVTVYICEKRSADKQA